MAMDNNIVEFPANEPAVEGRADNVDERHAKAFRDLEGRVSDCVTMAWLATQQVCNGEGVPGEVIFAVMHTHEMLAKLKTDYYAAWRGEKIDL
jgi:hypothetical protein